MKPQQINNEHITMTSRFNIKNIFLSVLVLMLSIIPLVDAEEFDGTLTWSKRVELSTPVNGIVQKVFSQQGKIAAKGDVLIQLDPRAFKAELKYSILTPSSLFNILFSDTTFVAILLFFYF